MRPPGTAGVGVRFVYTAGLGMFWQVPERVWAPSFGAQSAGDGGDFGHSDRCSCESLLTLARSQAPILLFYIDLRATLADEPYKAAAG